MNITIDADINDIASEEEIKEAALRAVRDAVSERFRGSEENLDRLIINLSYRFVWEMVDKQYDGKIDEILRRKIVDVINGLSAYDVFRYKDGCRGKDSVAYQILQEESENCRPLIKERVEQIINEYPFREIERDEIGWVIHDCIMDKLFPNPEGKK